MTDHEQARRLLADADPARTLAVDDADLADLRDIPSLGPDAVPCPVELVDLHGRRRRRVGVALGLAALTAAGGTAAAVSLLHPPAPEVAGIECDLAPPGGAILGASARPPIERCTEIARKAGVPVPDDLVVYQEPGRIPVVASRARGIPPGATILTQTSPDLRLVELHHAFVDAYAGVGFEANRPCQDMATTRAAAQALLDRVGLRGHTMAVESIDPGTTDTCVTARVDSDQPRVVLERRRPQTYPGPAAPDPEFRHVRDFERVVGRRATALSAGGASGGDLAAMVRATATEYRVPGNAYEVDVTDSPVNGPARLYFEIGGKDFFHIYAAG